MDCKESTELIIVSIYQCCVNPTNEIGITAYHQQEIQLVDMRRENTNPRANFSMDIQEFIEEKLAVHKGIRIPIIVGNWNETCKGNSTSQKLCDRFGLVDAWASINPNHPDFNTF